MRLTNITRTVSFAMLAYVAFGVLPLLNASTILEDTIPTGNLLLQPPVLTGAGAVFGPGVVGVVVADGFTVPVTASLDQISVAVDYEFFPQDGITGTSPMLLSLLSDNNDSPGAVLESWVVPLSPADTMLTVVTVNSALAPVLVAGQQYWVSEVPTNSMTTGIGWGLASPGYPGIQLPIAESTTGMNNGWLPTASNIANEFEVTGNVVTPEPNTLAICALALCSFVIWKRRQRATFSRRGVPPASRNRPWQ